MEQPRRPAGSESGGQFAHKQIADSPALDADLTLEDDTEASPPVRKVPSAPWLQQPRGKVRTRIVTFAIETDDDGNETVVPSTRSDEVLHALQNPDGAKYLREGTYFTDNHAVASRAGNIVAEMLQEGLVSPTGVQSAMRASANARSLTTKDLSCWMAATRTWAQLMSDFKTHRVPRVALPENIKRTGISVGTCHRTQFEKQYLYPLTCLVEWHLSAAPPVIHDDGSVTCGTVIDGHLINENGNQVAYVGENGKLLWRSMTEAAAFDRSPIRYLLEAAKLPVNPLNGKTFLQGESLVFVTALADKAAAEQVIASCRNSSRAYPRLLTWLARAHAEMHTLWQHPFSRQRMLDLCCDACPSPLPPVIDKRWDLLSHQRKYAVKWLTNLRNVGEPYPRKPRVHNLRAPKLLENLPKPNEAELSASINRLIETIEG